jgi:pSer/pThr/pTyr-binding forkhead associated (FHA) protein
MPVAVLTILKFCLLGLIFLFLTRVLRAVWIEINAPAPDAADLPPASPASKSSPEPSEPRDRRIGKGRGPSERSQTDVTPALTVVDPIEQRGQRYLMDAEMTIGRAPGCAIVITDTFASQLHARVFERDTVWYIEDLGSRNGTWVNRTQVHGPTKLEPGDRVKVGDTVLEMGSR